MVVKPPFFHSSNVTFPSLNDPDDDDNDDDNDNDDADDLNCVLYITAFVCTLFKCFIFSRLFVPLKAALMHIKVIPSGSENLYKISFRYHKIL